MSRDMAGGREAAGAAGADEPTDDKEELRRRMEESRDAITETVGEIKAVVAQQYEEVRGRVESVREAAGEVLDWRQQFDRNPVVWGAGAVSIGILIGLGLSRALEDDDDDETRSESLAGRAVSELTALADAVLPTVSAQVKELFGLDLDAYLRETRRPRPLRGGDDDDQRDGAGKADEKAAVKNAQPKRAAAKKAPSEKRAAKKGAGGKRAGSTAKRAAGAGKRAARKRDAD